MNWVSGLVTTISEFCYESGLRATMSEFCYESGLVTVSEFVIIWFEDDYQRAVRHGEGFGNCEC